MANEGIKWTIPDLLKEPCLIEFLRFLKVNPVLLSAYKTMVNSIIASIDASIAEMEMRIIQLQAIFDVENTLLTSYDSIVKQTTSLLNTIPFNQFKQCTPISSIVKLINDNIDPYNLPLIGNIKNRIYNQKRRKAYLENVKLLRDERKWLKELLQATVEFLELDP